MQVPCQLCGKKEANIHLTELDASGSPRELHVCGSCSQALGSQLEDGPPAIAALLEQATSAAVTSTEAAAEAESTETCPMCGLSYADYAGLNLFGCAHDYVAFGDQLELLLSRYHGASHHIGRQPSRAPSPGPAPSAPATAVAVAEGDTNGEAKERRRLEAELKDAVAKERYEDAARLRDALKGLGQEPE
jgi:protein arginine kinase activator